MAILAGDQFTDTNGVGLDTHLSYNGQSWLGNANFGTPTPAPQIQSNALVGQNSGANAWYLNYGPASGNYGVQIDFTPGAAPQDFTFAVYLHLDPATQTAYILEWASGRFELHKVVAGVDTFLVGDSARTLTNGTAYQIKLEFGATANALDGYFKTMAATSWTPMWTAGAVTDTSIAGPGYAGLQTRLSNGFTLDNFKIQDVGTPYNATFPPKMAVTSGSVVATSTGNTVTIQGTNSTWTTGTTFTATGSVSGNLTANITGTSINASTQVATLTFTAPATAQTVTFGDSADSATATLAVLTAATSIAITGPSTAFVGVQTTYTASLSPAVDGITGSATFTPSGFAGDTFTPSSVTLTTASPSATFVRVAAATGSHTITGTNTASNPTVGNGSLAVTDYATTTVLPGALNLTATRTGIGVELQVTGDSANVATAVVQFKKTADPTYRYALGCEGGQPVKTYITADNDGVGKAFYHAILQCSPGTGYTVQVTLASANGVGGTNPVVGTTTTLAENTFTPVGVRTPDYFVDPVAGSDAHAGTTWATAFATIDKGITTVNASGIASPVLGIGPGYPMASQTPITKAGATIIALNGTGTAANPATVAQNTTYGGVAFPEPGPAANAGSRTVVHAGVYTSPTGSGDLHAGPWVQQTFTGPVDALAHTVWKWAAVDVNGTPFTYAGVLGYASAKSDEPQRVASWNQSSLTVGGYNTNTNAGWAEIVQTNLMHNSGWFVDVTDHQTIYLELPANVNPNSYYIWIGSQNNSSSGTNAGFTIHADGVTICGFETRALQYGVLTNASATNWLVDHCYFALSQYHIYCSVVGTAYGTPTSYGHDGLVQYCLHKDSNLWATGGGTPNQTIPWHLCKDYVILHTGANYGVSVADLCQSLPVIYNGCRRLTWRYNTVDGTHDTGAVSASMQASPSTSGVDRYEAQDMEMLYNVIRHIQDDGPEPVSSCINGRALFNRIEYSLTAYSPNSLNYGPFFYCRNQVWRTGTDGQAPGGGTADALPGTALIKWGAVTPVDAWSYIAHNTFWTDSDVTRAATHELVLGMGDFSGNGHHNRFWFKNNVLRCTATRIFQPPQNTSLGSNDYWVEDYNQYASANADTTNPNGKAVDFGSDGTPVADYGVISTYRTGQSQSAHSNPVGMGFADVASTDATLTAPTTGDLRLLAGAGLIGAGTPLGNLSDILVANGGSLANGGYYGSAPDLGAVEYAIPAGTLTAALVGAGLLTGTVAAPYALAGGLLAIGAGGGALVAPYALTGSLTAWGLPSGALAVPYALAPSPLVGVGAVGGRVVAGVPLAAALAGAGLLAGSVAVPYLLTGALAGGGAYQAFLLTNIPLAQVTGGLIAVGGGAGALAVPYALDGALAGAGVGSGALAAAYALAGWRSGVGVLAGTPQTAYPLAATLLRVDLVAGALTVPVALAADLAGVGVLVAIPAAVHPLTASLLRVAVATAQVGRTYPTPYRVFKAGTLVRVFSARVPQ